MQESALYAFVPDKSLFHPKTFLKTFNSEFLYIEVWFADQNSKPLEIEDKIKDTLIMN